MKTALLCMFLAFIVQEGSWADDDFKPMPIPVNEWQPFEGSEARAGTLHDAPTAGATVPAHYWEDALRHSVYLTLVRDKIDQLISKGGVISPESKPEQLATKDEEDHDLWEKIKSAPFDRIKEEEQGSFGDVTIMAKGRLIEEKGNFRFTEDGTSKEKCDDEKCMEGVKAFWSVKRVRQREDEIPTGRYHYELTFSVNSHMPKKQKKTHENPVRTFTVRESDPERVVDIPQENHSHVQYPQPLPIHRPERAIWFHKNIVPKQRHQSRQYNNLERIFSSLFSDDDDYEPPRYRPNPHAPPPMYNSQFSKAGYIGSPSDQQKRLTPYPYKPQSMKYSRPPLGPPPYSNPHYIEQHSHRVEPDNYGNGNIQYGPPQDHRYVSPNKIIKTTRPALLPTPLEPLILPKNWTSEGENNNTDLTTNTPETATVYKNYSNKPRPPPLKINYMSDHVRPPVYNAPPGVFVTMDKKPFKPLPPMKYYHSKPIKQLRPIDFRPSPQVLDMQQFSEPDPLFDSAFRPMRWNDSNVTSTTTEKIEVAESSAPVNNLRKPVTKGKKPPKKHENIKPGTTSLPEIITASNESIEENDSLEWANVVGAFSKTTPMASQKEKHEVTESTTQSQTTTTNASTTGKRRTTTTTTTETVEELTTTAKPRKRTRPPPKFTKPDKVKKHKRITTTTTKAPAVKTTQDLTPQASSAAATKPSTQRPVSTSPVITTSTSTTTTPRPTTTTKATTSTTTKPTSISTETKLTASQQKSKNRFRISTLMQKGTSVKHDKWSATTALDNSQQKLALPLVSKHPPRRKGSNFQGYISSTTPLSPEKLTDEPLYSNKYNSNLEVMPLSTSTATYDDAADQYDYSTSHDGSDMFENDEYEDSDEQDTKEYIFQSSSTTPSENTNEIGDQDEPHTTEQVLTSPYAATKNKTKCKKKKTQTTTPVNLLEESDSTTTLVTLTTESSTKNIFEELFGAFTLDEKKEEASKLAIKTDSDQSQQESKNHGEFVKLDDDLQDFLDSLDKENNKSDSEMDELGYEDDEDDEPAIDEDDSPYNTDEESASPRDTPDGHNYNDRYSLLELMAME